MYEETRRFRGPEEVLELERGRAGRDERDGDCSSEACVDESDVFLEWSVCYDFNPRMTLLWGTHNAVRAHDCDHLSLLRESQTAFRYGREERSCSIIDPLLEFIPVPSLPGERFDKQ